MAEKTKVAGGKKKRKPVEKETSDSPTPSGIPVTAPPEKKYLEPDEWYTAVFDDAEVKEGTYGPYILLNFTICNGFFEGTEDSAKGWKSSCMLDAKLFEGSKLWVIVKSLIGRDPEEGENVNLTPYYGNKYKIFIEDKKRKGNTEAIRRQNVTKVKKIRKVK